MTAHHKRADTLLPKSGFALVSTCQRGIKVVYDPLISIERPAF